MPKTDFDLEWLRTYVPAKDAPPLHNRRVDQLYSVMNELIAEDRLPVSIGLFGGWGSGKTTFLSLLAQKIAERDKGHKVIYFNAWKYAGFTEIVPCLIYKILKFGNHAAKDPNDAIKEIMVSLGKEYSDKLGEWAEKRVGVNPVKLFKDASAVYDSVRTGVEAVSGEVIDAYYTQLDRAQDLLLKVFSDRSRITIVLIDELDRCDPEEAFAVIKQLRVFFAMRQLPIAFILCANPEPIGLAIKHKYGLTTASGEFEARRILEKFVDVYYDMAEPMRLDKFVAWLWNGLGKEPAKVATLQLLDEKFVVSNIHLDVTKNATALQSMQSDNPLFANLRLLRKTFERVVNRSFSNKHMLWTAWHLEIAEQMDPLLRREIRTASEDLMIISADAYRRVFNSTISWLDGRMDPLSNPGGTLFGLYRSEFWNCAKSRIEAMHNKSDPETTERTRILGNWITDYHRMDFIILATLIPLEGKDNKLERLEAMHNLNVFVDELQKSQRQLGYLLANY